MTSIWSESMHLIKSTWKMDFLLNFGILKLKRHKIEVSYLEFKLLPIYRLLNKIIKDYVGDRGRFSRKLIRLGL